MKNYKLLFSTLFLFLITSIFSQNYKKVFFKEMTYSTDDYDITIVDQVANEKELKFKVKFINKTKDLLMIKPSQFILVTNDKEYKNTEKDFYIDPFESGSKVINYPLIGFLNIREFKLKSDAMFILPLFEKQVNAPELILPPSQNDFKAGDFVCTITNIKKESDQTYIKFKCRYEGNDFGVISINKPSVLMPDGNKYATTKTKENNKVLKKGEEGNLSVNWDKMPGGAKMDMQKVPMTVFWNETFSVSKPKKLSSFELSTAWNEELTNLKGK